ncbi:MAG: hypothetical protein LBF19_02610 [Prevotellaceae bacterium]|jgi:hypothetical protein|nr:hypothetical protein [Prevotellaceae bacterium]
MSKDFIPRSYPSFNVWQGNLVTKVVAGATGWNIPADAVTRIQTKQARWQTAFAVANDPATRTSAAVKEQQEAWTDYVAELRPFIKAYLTYSLVVTNVDRENLGLPLHDTRPTPPPVIAGRPEVDILFSAVQKHTLVVRDSTSQSAAKPKHALGFEIWRKVGGEPPASDSDWTLVVTAPHSPYDLHYNQSESGLRVYYRLRWVNTMGVAGDWSETVSAIIG